MPSARTIDVVSAVVSVAAVAAAGLVFVRTMQGESGALGSANVSVLAVASCAAAAVAAMLCQGLATAGLATTTLAVPPLLVMLSAWAGTPGKYLPAKVGSMALRASWLARAGAPAGPALLVCVVEVLVALAVAAAVATLCLGRAFVGLVPGPWLLVVVVVGVAAAAALAWWARHRAQALASPTAAAVVGTVVVDVVGCFAQGLGLWGALHVVGADVGAEASVVGVVGVVAASAIAGVLSPVPAGIGVRELGALSLLSALGVVDGVAARAILAWRLASVAVEVSVGVLAMAVLRARLRPVPERQPGGP